MKKVFLLALTLLASVIPVHAQDTKSQYFRRFEIGWNVLSYMHQGGDDFIGTNLSFAVHKSDRLGFVAEYAIHEEAILFSSSEIRTYRFGPRFYMKPKSRLKPFAEILVGGSHAQKSTTSGFFGFGTTTVATPAENGFALLAGGGLDMRIKPWIAWRVVEADYSFLRLAGNSSNGIRVDTGILFRFGH
jgi:hypothetical protein